MTTLVAQFVAITIGFIALFGITGTARSDQVAVSCSARLEVSQYHIEISRSRTRCEKAIAVSRAAFESFVENPSLGDHGVFLGFKCVFGPASTPDFSTPKGPILFCRSWDHFIVASAEPSDPPTSWRFERTALTSDLAKRYGIREINHRSGRSWRSYSKRSVNCSSRVTRLVRLCAFRWRSGGAKYSARLRVQLIPKRWEDAKIRVTGTVPSVESPKP